MKKFAMILLVALLLTMCGCQNTQPEPTETMPPETTTAPPTEPITEPTTEPTTEPPTEPPTEPEPQCADAEVQVDRAPVILTLLSRGDTVDIVGEYDETHYVVSTESGYGLMERQLLRFQDEPEYEAWTGYAYSSAGLYDNYQLQGEPVEKLNLNTKIEILDQLDYCYVVKIGEKTGFIAKSEVSTYYIQYSGGGGGGADGGDISLQYGGVILLSSIIDQGGEVTGQAQVLADGAHVLLGYFDLGDVAPVVTEEGFAPAWEGYYTLYLNGMYGYLPANLALMEGEEAYTQWDGYTAYKARVYDHYLCQGDGVKLNTNTVVTVLWDGGHFYVVSLNGEIGYMAHDTISQTRHATGGGGGGGDDWTPPIK